MISAGSVAPSTSVTSSGLPSPSSDILEDNPSKLLTYLHQLAGCYEMEVDVILKDHCYARPWNWKPENVYVKPTKKLFFSKSDLSIEKYRQDEEIDVDGDVPEPQAPPLDMTRARHLMDEFQRLASFARPDDNDDWEEKIDKTLWPSVQSRVFTKVVRILNSERLARLAKANSPTEPIFRRISVDTAAKRFRETLASVGWDWRVAQWLHSLLFEHLPQEYLAIYLDILQTLRLKIPQLIDKMIAVQPNINGKSGPITWETLGTLLKRSWDPVTPSLNTTRLKKLPGNPILIIAPSGVGSSVSSRQHKWATQLGALGMVVNVHTHLGLAVNRMTMMVCIDQLVQATRAKIQDVRSDCPGRPVILVGFNTGAALACQVAQMEHVTAVVCLGFPFATAEGKRGTPDDTLLDIRCPVMFVIGQNATLVRPDDLEDLREKMQVETSLVVVGSADDHLRISTAKKISEGVTQSMVDRCILDEIGDFVGSILMQPHPLPLRSTSMTNYEKSNKRDRKRKNSTSSSVESEPNSPTIKKSRPTTPVCSSSGQTTASTSVTKSGTLNTQPTLVTVGNSQANNSPALKRKPRVISNQKGHYMEHLITTRISGQQSTNSASGGITLNIGSLASLSPIGPIRLAPTTVTDQPATIKANSTPKSPVSSSKVPKIVQTNVPLQTVSKIKTVLSGTKNSTRMMPSNHRNINAAEKNGDTKFINVSSTAGSQIKTSTATSPADNAGGSGQNSLQNGKSTITLPSPSPSPRASSSSILLTPNNPASTAATTTSTTTKVADSAGTSDSYATAKSSRSLDTLSQVPLQTTVSGTKDNSFGASYANIVVLGESSEARSVSSSSAEPANIFSLAGKMRVSHKQMKSMPKITVNTNNLQRSQKARNPGASKTPSELDDDLGNILDIPIIFAKDDENLNAIEKLPVPSTAESQEKVPSKPSNTTKVVLISNKQSKLQQATNKIVAPSGQTIICPTVQNLNHVILQTQSQNVSLMERGRVPIQTISRAGQPAVKYTKIILTKRNSSQGTLQGERKEQIILTKTTPKMSTSRILSVESNEHKYAHASSKVLQSHFGNEPLEIEDAIKTNIIERKSAIVSATEVSQKDIEKVSSEVKDTKDENVQQTAN